MSSTVVMVVAISIVIVSAMAAILAMSRRQYDETPPSTGRDGNERPPGSGGLRPPAGLAPVVVSTITEATRIKPRNSSEAASMTALRTALSLAVDGEFAVEVRSELDQIGGLEILHDVRKSGVGGAAVDHLVVAPIGVVVVDSVVSATKVTFDRDAVYVGRDRSRRRHAMVDQVLREMAAVVGLVDEIPVHGVIVFKDVLGLPPEIRAGTAVVRGVRLMTLLKLGEVLTRPGSLAELALVAAVLRAKFRPALATSHEEIRLNGLTGEPSGQRAPTPEPP